MYPIRACIRPNRSLRSLVLSGDGFWPQLSGNVYCIVRINGLILVVFYAIARVNLFNPYWHYLRFLP